MSKYDAVNPGHYKKGGKELFQILGRLFCLQNVIKYVCRYKDKNGLEDLKKAQKYLDLAQFTERCTVEEFLNTNPHLNELQVKAIKILFDDDLSKNQKVIALKPIINDLIEQEKMRQKTKQIKNLKIS